MNANQTLTPANVTVKAGPIVLGDPTLPPAPHNHPTGDVIGLDMLLTDLADADIAINANLAGKANLTHNHTTGDIVDLDDMLTGIISDITVLESKTQFGNAAHAGIVRPTGNITVDSLGRIDCNITTGGGGSNYTLPIANSTTLGGVIPAGNITVDGSGKIDTNLSKYVPVEINTPKGYSLLSMRGNDANDITMYMNDPVQSYDWMFHMGPGPDIALSIDSSGAGKSGQASVNLDALNCSVNLQAANNPSSGQQTQVLLNAKQKRIDLLSQGEVEACGPTSVTLKSSGTSLVVTPLDAVLNAAAGRTWSANSILTEGHADTRYIKQPGTATANQILTYNGTQWLAGNAPAGGGGSSYTLPAATNATLGGVIPGGNITVDGSGHIDANLSGYIPQANWANTPFAGVTNLNRSFGIVGTAASGAIGVGTSGQIRISTRATADTRAGTISTTLSASCMTQSTLANETSSFKALGTSAQMTYANATLVPAMLYVDRNGFNANMKVATAGAKASGTADTSFAAWHNYFSFTDGYGFGFDYTSATRSLQVLPGTVPIPNNESYIYRGYADTRYIQQPATATANQVLTFDGTNWTAANALSGGGSVTGYTGDLITPDGLTLAIENGVVKSVGPQWVLTVVTHADGDLVPFVMYPGGGASTGVYVDWGDGSPKVTNPPAGHAYAKAGTYIIKVTLVDPSQGGILGGNDLTLKIGNNPFITKIGSMQFFVSEATFRPTAESFSNMTSVSELPPGFLGHLGINTFMGGVGIFEGWTSLTSVPENLFAGVTTTSVFSRTFYGCTALKHVPANLLKTNTDIANFPNFFNGCTLDSNDYGDFLISLEKYHATGAKTFHGGHSKYPAWAAAAVTALKARGWNITDGGPV